ncbi:MAG: molybdopterin-dependent oxidoreductase, partial [Gemmatimonadetes bacterium]|nr:molybdopterin-dependent oxidoreductase [Gemmatimonadota bacterium]NIW77639.1 molybdopterin-dependent oxidoreductase [Gemmatimonadota bacterium]
TNVAFAFPIKTGDPDATFERAPVRLTQRLVNQRLIPVAIEPRSVVAEYDPGYEKLTVTTSTQIP